MQKWNAVQRWLYREPEAWKAPWISLEGLHRCVVFGITGSTSMFFVRPILKQGLGLDYESAPVPYVICTAVTLTPFYSALLVCVGTVFGRHMYYRRFAAKMWGRFGVPHHRIDPWLRQIEAAKAAGAHLP